MTGMYTNRLDTNTDLVGCRSRRCRLHHHADLSLTHQCRTQDIPIIILAHHAIPAATESWQRTRAAWRRWTDTRGKGEGQLEETSECVGDPYHTERQLIRLLDTAFKQQRLKAWQPILTPKVFLPTFFILGVLFAPLGGLLIWGSNLVSGFSCADSLTYIMFPRWAKSRSITPIATRRRPKRTPLISNSRMSSTIPTTFGQQIPKLLPPPLLSGPLCWTKPLGTIKPPRRHATFNSSFPQNLNPLSSSITN